jgi:ribose/xylose/arabinose/galactoside ABC-type transport system permease subunit
MTQSLQASQAPTAPARPQPRRKPLTSTLLARPEIGALAAAIIIFVLFLVVAPPFRSPAALSTVLYDSSTIGIMAVGVALLMIGGEFDLSAGVAVIASALTASMISYQLGLNLWVGAFVALALALLVGFINGYLVVKTGIPSFLITLSTFFMLQGLNLGITKLITGTVSTQSISAMDGYGALKAWFYGLHRLYAFSTVQSGEGVGNEFLYIIAAVVGGCLLTGGYGSAIGAAIGAFIFGMTRQGIVYAGWDPNWYRFFLGAMLLLATILNLYVKRLSSRR